MHSAAGLLDGSSGGSDRAHGRSVTPPSRQATLFDCLDLLSVQCESCTDLAPWAPESSSDSSSSCESLQLYVRLYRRLKSYAATLLSNLPMQQALWIWRSHASREGRLDRSSTPFTNRRHQARQCWTPWGPQQCRWAILKHSSH